MKRKELSMKRFLTLALVGALVLGASSVAYANVCAFDPVPAATLLYPFVVYNYDAGDAGYNTLFSVTNVSSEAQIVHFTVWTDFSVAILDFNVILTGYDQQSISIRDILRDGHLPVTTYDFHTTTEGANETGPVSDDNTVAAWNPTDLPQPQATRPALAGRCEPTNPAYPGFYTQAIPGSLLGLFQTWLQSSQDGAWANSENCAGTGAVAQGGVWYYNRDTTDDTWMYITADVVQTCNKTFPDQAAYWQGEARFENVIKGEVIYVNLADRYSETLNAIHIEADTELGTVATLAGANPISFYHRYSILNGAPSDFREPLPTAWAINYIGAETAGLDTNLRAFKASSALRFPPDGLWADTENPSTFIAKDPIAYTYYSWDTEENVITFTQFPWSSPEGGDVVPNLLPLETQQVSIEEFSTVDDSGWMLFIWPYSNVPFGATPPVGCDDFYQTWMGVQYVLDGAYSGAKDGVVMANYNCFADQILPQLGINYDYVP